MSSKAVGTAPGRLFSMPKRKKNIQYHTQFAQQEAAAAAVPPAPAETENQVGHARLVEHVYHLEIQHSYGIYIYAYGPSKSI